MMIRIRLVLTQEEFSALLAVAERELRSPGEQARMMIRQELERRGLLVREGSEVNRAAMSNGAAAEGEAER